MQGHRNDQYHAKTENSLANMIKNNLKTNQHQNETPLAEMRGSTPGMKSSQISSGCQNPSAFSFVLPH